MYVYVYIYNFDQTYQDSGNKMLHTYFLLIE